MHFEWAGSMGTGGAGAHARLWCADPKRSCGGDPSGRRLLVRGHEQQEINAPATIEQRSRIEALRLRVNYC